MSECIYLRWADSRLTQLMWLNPPQGAPVVDDYLQVIAKLPSNALIVLLLAGEQVTLLQGEVPDVSDKQLSQVLPFSFETQIADDVDANHFTLLKRGHSGASSTVLVVRREYLSACLAPLYDAGLKVDFCTADYLALPSTPAAWHVYIGNHFCLGRLDTESGFGCQTEDFSDLLSVLMPSLEEHTLQISVAPTLNPELLDTFVAQAPITEAWEQRQPVDLAKSLLPPDAIAATNLLHGPFVRKQNNRQSKVLLFAAVATVVLAAVLQVGGLLFFNHQLQQQQDVLDAKMLTLYREVFPNATSLNSPKILLQRELDKLKSGSGQAGFLRLLAKYSAIEHAQIHITSLNYQNSRLTIGLQTESFEALEQLIAKLREKSLQVKQDEAFGQGEQVQARITLSEGMA